MLKYNTEFDKIVITFVYQNDRLLELENKANLALLANKQKYYGILQNQEEEK